MLKNRRYRIIFLGILIASVFLSCGIGLPYTIEETISFNADTNEISINTETIHTTIVNGPSLVLLYGYSETQILDATISSYISTINSSWSTAKSPVVGTDTTKKQFSQTIDGTTVDFYLFMPEKDTKLKDFDYHYSLKDFYTDNRITTPNSSHVITMTENVDGNYPTFNLNDESSWRVYPELSILQTPKQGTKIYFYTFAAITSSNGSNVYTTKLTFLNSFIFNTK